MPAVPVLRRQKQESYGEFKAAYAVLSGSDQAGLHNKTNSQKQNKTKQNNPTKAKIKQNKKSQPQPQRQQQQQNPKQQKNTWSS